VGDPLGTLLFLFGIGFLVANLAIVYGCVQDWRRRRQALLVWRMPPPRYAALPMVVAVGLGALIVYKMIVLQWPVGRLFGEGMMLAYYGYLFPVSLQIRRGFFEEGVRLDRGFARWWDITGLTWHDGPPPVLVIVFRHKERAGRLTVPLEHFGAARRILRDRVASHQLQFPHPPLDLGGHDERQDV
jgi:hypothetical protein